MDRKELIKKYIEFFKSKGHKEIRNSSLVPENDPTVLFTTAGMHPLVPYLLGQKYPLGKKLVNVQRCVRTGDIDKVGDGYHHTFFEMLGNWSLGDYFKKEAINWSFEFLTKILKIPKEKISVTCFAGDKNAEKDDEAANIWIQLGINKIDFLGKEDNWWETTEAGPCGPDTEMFVNGVEIWNDVFMQYIKDTNGNYKPAKQKNVDTGMGVERTTAILAGLDDDYLTECFLPIIKKIEEISGKNYPENKKEMRIIADHLKAAVFIVNDGVIPGNSEKGYVLRRLIRRAVRFGRILGLEVFARKVAEKVFDVYDDYKNIQENKIFILDEIEKEETKFLLTLKNGMNIFRKISRDKKKISGKDAFLLFQSYGFPLELTKEMAEEKGINVDISGFQKELEGHKKLSRTASIGQFKSGLADNSEETTKLHTAAHLLMEALRCVLDKNIQQKGSNITAERLRLDFNFSRKLTPEEIKKIEDLVNEKIKEKIKVKCGEMSVNEAKKAGAQGVFESKYGEKVFVYSIGNFSKEICAGPHVRNTSELGKFKITKEESSGAGVRRIKAILE